VTQHKSQWHAINPIAPKLKPADWFNKKRLFGLIKGVS